MQWVGIHRGGRGRQEPPLVECVWVGVSRRDVECPAARCSSWRQHSPSGAHLAGCTSGGLMLRCSSGDEQWPGLVLISPHLGTCLSTLVSAVTVKTKWSVISEVERVTYAGKTGVSGKPGFVVCGCG